jgi:hypothetical protein
VTSVAIARESIPGMGTGSGWIACGMIVAVIGVGTLLGSLERGDEAGSMIAVAFVAGGALGVYKGMLAQKAYQKAFQFVIRMRSASGEQQVYVSRDEAHVRRIVAALNTAIST